ncbi:hypothetical protein CC86DRAFT_459016 [Ophiobolus disseminans]|uniref:Uncharacterized protein n=1 Tax=Ophiobolus disseminans TaxID=1469910 RepID=A0A6A6ZLY5_9PLEO|nr:hypothetical protein CC86DRAFT_459016 [Ophiobolus disseminans]
MSRFLSRRSQDPQSLLSLDEQSSVLTPVNRHDACSVHQALSPLSAAAATAVERTTKRPPLARLDENDTSKRRKLTKSSQSPKKTPANLTKDALNFFEEHYNIDTASFDGEVRSRVLQETGKQMGFNLKLDCYEQAACSFRDWLEYQTASRIEQPVFKDKEDIESVDALAKAFDISLANASRVQCEA